MAGEPVTNPNHRIQGGGYSISDLPMLRREHIDGYVKVTDEEFYPMPFFATLTVDDLDASTHWYVDVLGFRLVFSMPGPNGVPSLSHLRWTKYADLLLVPAGPQTSSKTDKGVGVRLSFLVTESSVDELAERVRARGDQIAEGPVTQPWNTREFTVRDPNGYTLTFFK